MNKKKAIVCTVLFAVVLIGVIIGSMFVNSVFDFTLYDIIANAVFAMWTCKQIKSFHNWMYEE